MPVIQLIMRIIELFRIHNLKLSAVLSGIFIMMLSVENNAQCPISLGCNDAIQISLGFDCDAEITPELILEDERDNCAYMVNIKTEDDRIVETTEVAMNGDLIFPRVDGSYIGDRWKAEVFFVNDNNTTITCWGFFTVEDKLPPVVSCIEDFTVNCNEDLTGLFSSSSSVTYTSMGDDLDSNPNTVTVAMCKPDSEDEPQPWEVIESATLSFVGLSTGSGSASINGNAVPFSVANNMISGDIIGTQIDTSTCINFTFSASSIPVTGISTTVSSVSFFDYQVLDNCDPNLEVIVTRDETVSLDCVDDITAERVVRYYTQDDAGLSADFCEFRISFLKKSLSDIVFPENYTVDCNDAPNNLDPVNTGQPMLDGNIIMDEDNLCRINVTFSDDTFNLCGANTIKILRRWTALDWCLGQYSQSYQTILVEDNTPPLVTCPVDDMVFVSGTDCTATVVFKPLDPTDRTGAALVTECSDVSVQVEFLRGDERDPDDINQPFNLATPIGNNMWRADGLQSGRNWIRYVFTDECGLTAECRFEIIVSDDNAPVPVCDQFTAVSLDDSGWGRVYPPSIDDGSFDQCGGPVGLEIRRSDSVCSGQSSDRTFGDFVSFCCEEAGDTVMVMLRVTDDGGRSNTCEVSVVVQDKSGFSITCPSRLNIDLDCSEINNIGVATYGTAAISDDCGAGDISFADVEDFDDQCGQGTVERTFSLTINGVTETLPQCTQTFNFSSDVVLTQSSFVFPSDREDATCENFSTDLGDAPTFNGVPVNEAAFCGDLTYTFEDLVFEQVEGFCIKVIRTWTVIDWCTHDPNVSSTIGKWSDIQIVKVSNSEGPQLDGCPEDITIDIEDSSCVATTSFTAPTATDLCNSEDLDADDIGYVINGPGNFSRNGSGNIPSTAIGVGTYNVTWSAEGICGAVSTCSHSILVRDIKAPTPYCLSGVTTVLMEANDPSDDPSVEIWAEDFDLGSTDNCGPVQVSFSSNVNDQFMTFDCSDIGVTELEIWVTDSSGNQDFCTTTIDIQANDNICDTPVDTTGTGTRIAGRISTEAADMVEGVEVILQNMFSNTVEFSETNTSGQFAFSDNNANADYRVAVSSGNDYLNGVSTIDLLHIQRHILGSQKLDSPYKVVAADVDNSASITALDLIELRKLILGIYDELPKNDSWRFVDKTQSFNDPLTPWPLEESIDIYNISDDMMSNDFVAVKIGDVNNSVIVNYDDTAIENRTEGSTKLTNEILEITNGKYLIPFYLEDVQQIQGMQVNLTVGSQAKIVEVEAGKLKLNATNYNLTENGVKILWHDTEAITVAKEEALFYLTVVNYSGEFANAAMQVATSGMQSELYTQDDRILSLQLGVNGVVENKLFQNTPNPFSDQTLIHFHLYKSMDVQLTIFDMNGRTVHTIDNNYAKGDNTIEILPSHLQGSGIYYYQLSAESYIDSRKMIFIE
jgi:hypothetical protein